jgi:16S rRNA (guanine527-N7)-methyltransferase
MSDAPVEGEPGERLPLLTMGAPQLGFTLGERQLEQFQFYYEMMLDWNNRVNLTAILDYEGVQLRHFLDSLTVGAALLNEISPGGKRTDGSPQGLRLIDVGTGAGFPGVPLKIAWPGIHLTLADSIAKRTNFLSELVAALGLSDVDVLTARAEELGRDKAHREQYNVATARAVALLPVLCEYCLPLVRLGGWMLAPKKGDISQELEDAKRAVRLLGGGGPRMHRFLLPGEQEERYVVAIKKVKPNAPRLSQEGGAGEAAPSGHG